MNPVRLLTSTRTSILAIRRRRCVCGVVHVHVHLRRPAGQYPGSRTVTAGPSSDGGRGHDAELAPCGGLIPAGPACAVWIPVLSVVCPPTIAFVVRVRQFTIRLSSRIEETTVPPGVRRNQVFIFVGILQSRVNWKSWNIYRSSL